LIAGYAKQPKPKWPYVAAVVIVLFVCAIILFSILSANNPEEKIIIVKEKPQVKVQGKPGAGKTTASTTTTTSTSTTTSAVSTTTSTTLKAESKAAVSNAEIKVERIVFSSRIDSQNLPTDDLSEFSLNEKQKIFCYTKISAADVPQAIRHVWINPSGSVIAQIDLMIRNRPAHTWSYIGLSDAIRGKWEVEVRTAGGKVIAKRSFTIY